MSNLIVVVPSRGRPGNAARLLRDFAATAELASTRLWLAVDADDPELESYRALDLPRWATLFAGTERGLNAVLNRWTAVAADQSTIVGFMGDDHAPRTSGWDKAIAATLDGISGVAYGNDQLMSEKLPTAAFITSDLVRSLGFFSPPCLTHLCLDVFWMELGKATNLRYLPNIIIEHLHPANGKGQWDDRYAAVNNQEMVARDSAAWYAYEADQWPVDRTKLKLAGLAR